MLGQFGRNHTPALHLHTCAYVDRRFIANFTFLWRAVEMQTKESSLPGAGKSDMLPKV